MAIVYQYDAAGYYVGPSDDYGAAALPHNTTREPAPLANEYIPRWTGRAWEQVENHKGREGWLNGQPHKITEYGPLPEGWSDNPPEPTAEELAERRRAAIEGELDAIDRRGRRASRAAALALARGQAVDPDDLDKLAELEAQADVLRVERKRLEVGNG